MMESDWEIVTEIPKRGSTLKNLTFYNECLEHLSKIDVGQILRINLIKDGKFNRTKYQKCYLQLPEAFRTLSPKKFIYKRIRNFYYIKRVNNNAAVTYSKNKRIWQK